MPYFKTKIYLVPGTYIEYDNGEEYFLRVSELGLSAYSVRMVDSGWSYPKRDLGENLGVIIPVDYDSKDKKYWLDLKKRVYSLFEYKDSDLSRQIWKKIRQLRNIMESKEWYHVLSPEIVKWAEEELHKHQDSEGDSCVDNERVAQVGNTHQNRRYERQLKSGCCGFADFVRRGPDGKRYKLGYNYGH